MFIHFAAHAAIWVAVAFCADITDYGTVVDYYCREIGVVCVNLKVSWLAVARSCHHIEYLLVPTQNGE